MVAQTPRRSLDALLATAVSKSADSLSQCGWLNLQNTSSDACVGRQNLPGLEGPTFGYLGSER